MAEELSHRARLRVGLKDGSDGLMWPKSRDSRGKSSGKPCYSKGLCRFISLVAGLGGGVRMSRKVNPRYD